MFFLSLGDCIEHARALYVLRVWYVDENIVNYNK